jgi:hypothetical protein
MHFYTLAFLLVFFSFMFTKVVCVVFFRFWIWVIEFKFFPFKFFFFLVLTFFHIQFFSLLFFSSFLCFLFLILLRPPRLVLLWVVASSTHPTTSTNCLLVLHCHLVALMASSLPYCLVAIIISSLLHLPHCFIVVSSQLVTASMPRCFVAIHHYLTTSLPCRSLSLPHYLVALLRWVEVPSNPPICCFVVLHLVTSLFCCLTTFVG